MVPQIVQVVPTENYTVYVYFEDGKIVLYDVKPLLEKGIFTKIKEKDMFIGRCMILNDTLAWDIKGNRDETSCLDIAPDMLYSLEHIEGIA